MRISSLEGKLALLLIAAAIVAAALAAALGAWTDSAWLGGVAAIAVCLLPLAWAAHASMQPVRRLLRALSGSVASYRDGDFSISLRTRRRDELGQLIEAHNELGHALREQRQNLVQRELLLDTVVQHSPTALVLTDAGDHIVYANLAARHLFNEGKSPVGASFEELLDACPEPMRQALTASEDSLFGVEMGNDEEYFHLSRRDFRLQGSPHRLYLVQRMTRELSRQEVAVWKRVIRVISHELNNSLAPISSLAHSGAELARRGDMERLPKVFEGIGERVRHLHSFTAGYASFAKLPQPNPAPVDWAAFLDALRMHCEFRLVGDVPAEPGRFDATQVEQVLINLIKNAHESGSSGDEVTLAISHVLQSWRIEVADRGPGMSGTVLAQALLPFYSTKRSGTGLGLALAREIIEAHGGRIVLANRENGGLRVSVSLPASRI
ncbi:MAG TPA: ATP-binding protein [Rhodanobacteraceae bacterium]|jgi:nitrogen fixation/metabolism regulation signal transduction histidine kinase|nr:ATP-binding protein [Rhodanobacteraceae bacterium]